MKNVIFIVLVLCSLLTKAQTNKGHILDSVGNLSNVLNPTTGMEVVCTCDNMPHVYINGHWYTTVDSSHVISMIGNVLPYISYQAVLSQTGTAAPTPSRKDINFSGITFTWARTSAGIYTLTASSGIFTTGKTIVYMSVEPGSFQKFTAIATSTTVITVSTTIQSVVSLLLSVAGTDALLTNTGIDVRVYN